MKISEIEKILKDIKEKEGNVEVLVASVNDTELALCFKDSNFKMNAYKVDCKKI